MRLTILGKHWWLRFCRLTDCRGECDSPTEPKKEIRISNQLIGEERLEVLIHEQLHAAQWHLDEEFVRRFAEDLARNLTKLGYSNDAERIG